VDELISEKAFEGKKGVNGAEKTQRNQTRRLTEGEQIKNGSNSTQNDGEDRGKKKPKF